MLTNSIDSEPFRVEPRESTLSRRLTPSVIKQAVKTVMSAVNESVKTGNSEIFEEHIENSVAKEFESVLKTIVKHMKD
jgi:ribosomal protein S20